MNTKTETPKFSKAVMAKHKRRMGYRRELCNMVKNIFDNARRFHWSSSDISSAINEKIRGSYQWKQLPQYEHNYVNSRIDYFRELMQHDGTIVFAYWIIGEFVPTNTEKYKRLAPKHVYGNNDCPSAHVYSEDPEKVFFGYRSETNLNLNRGL